MSPRLAEAVARIVRSIAGVTENEIWVKPANDVMCEAGKLCGMSLDAKDGKSGTRRWFERVPSEGSPS